VGHGGQRPGASFPRPILEAAKKTPDWKNLAQAAGFDPNMTDVPHDLALAGKWPKDINFTLKDGLFIGTIFKPAVVPNVPKWEDLPEAKPGMLLEDCSLQDECFYGSITRAEASDGGFEKGHYYLLGLGRRVVVELTGLDDVQRLGGGFVDLGEAGVAAARRQRSDEELKKRAAQGAESPRDVLARPGFNNGLFEGSNPIVIPEGGEIALWHNESGLGVAAHLDECYRPGAPLSQVFVNQASRWEEAFRDECVDLLIGDNLAADPHRAGPAPGDQRIVFAERKGKLEIVRYFWKPADAAPAGARTLAAGRQGEMAWVADRLDLPNDGITRGEPIYYNTYVNFNVTIPWKILNLKYKPGMKIHVKVGISLRRPGGAGISRRYWAGGLSSTAYDFATALEMRPDLWRTIVFRPAGFVLPPDVSAEKPAPTGKPLAVNFASGGASSPATYADAFTWVSADQQSLKLKWYVAHDDSPFVNRGTDLTMLFKTGDACDLQIDSPALGKCRYLVTMFASKPVVVRYRYVAKDAKPEEGVWFRSPAGNVFVPIVERLPIVPQVQRGDDWYTVEVALPWTTLGIKPAQGGKIPAELGVLRSDPAGVKTVSRNYWNSGLSGMTQDVPTEVKPTENWGIFQLH
jgi:hypothetical protein